MDCPHLILIPPPQKKNCVRTNPPQWSDFVSWKNTGPAISHTITELKLIERELRQLCGNIRNAIVHIVSSYSRVYINYKQLRIDTNTPSFICF